MKKGKIAIFLLILIISIVGIISSRNRNNSNEEVEYIEKAETKIVLYFSDLEKGELVKEYRYVELDDIKNDIATTIINQLLKGPENQELVSVIPVDTKLNSILLEKEKIIVDFSEEFEKDSEDELRNLHKIYSVVNSLTEITEINEVEIKVNGKIITSKVRL